MLMISYKILKSYFNRFLLMNKNILFQKLKCVTCEINAIDIYQKNSYHLIKAFIHTFSTCHHTTYLTEVLNIDIVKPFI